MRRIGALLVVAIGLGAGMARAETLDALVKREEGVEFGPCTLTPKPALAGDVHLVIPARFATPGIWVTRTILLVGIDGAKTVQGTLELMAAHDIPPRQVISVTCKGGRIAVRLKGKTLTYAFDGKALRKAGGRK